MLYVKLTLRNLQRSMKEYAIFMLTMVISMMLMYSFMAVAFSEQVLQLSKHMDAFAQVILVVSMGLVIVIGWLISYIANFMLRKRSREFGMYLLMGMTRKQVCRMFLLEQFCMGLFAYGIGCILGLFTFQILLAIIQHIFGIAYQFAFRFSIPAAGVTFLAFLILYAYELVKEYRILHHVNIHTLLYQDQQNETVKKGRLHTLVYMLGAILCAAVGLKLFYDGMRNGIRDVEETKKLLPAVLLIIASIYACFLGLSGFLQHFLDQHKQLKYQHNRMFLLGRLQGRLRSNRIVLATLSLLTLVTICFLCFGMKFKETTDLTIHSAAPFDLQVITQHQQYIKKAAGFLAEKKLTYEDHTYQTYTHLRDDVKVKQTFAKALDHTAYDSTYYRTTTFMRYADVQRLLQLKGKKVPALEKDEYMLVVSKKQQELMESYCRKHPFTINGKPMKLRYVCTEEILQTMYFVVVPDVYVQGVKGDTFYYVAQSAKELPSAWEDQLYERCSNSQLQEYSSVRLHSSYVETSMFSYVAIVFCLFYAAFIFICAAGTILATQQLSDLEAQKYEYALLHKMGASRKTLYRLLHYQNLLYFLLPLLLPAFFMIPILNSLDIMFTTTDATTPMYMYLGITLALFFTIYLAYYALTYISCRRNLDI